jgi:MFS transporter, ACS family, tartrate transporter
VAYRTLADGPAQASWLKEDEKTIVVSRLAVEGATAHRDIGLALRDWRVLGLGLAAAGIQFCASGIQFWVPQIVQGQGFSNGIVGFIVALPFLFGTVAMILWGYSSDLRGDRIWHIALAALFSAAGLIVAGLSESAFIMLVGLTAAIAGMFSTLPVINSIPPSFLRGPAAAGGIALFNMIAQFGGFFGPVVMGVLKQNTGGYAAGLLSLALAISLSALVVLGLGRAMSVHRAAATAASA